VAAPAWAAERKSIVFVPRFMPESLDPIATPSIATRTAAMAVFETLYGVDAGMNPTPQMLERHTVEDDGRIWTLTLRTGLTFHDGAAVTAADCVASLRRWMARDRVGLALATRLDRLRATDARTITVRLKTPLPRLPVMLTRGALSPPVIMPERLAATPPDQPVEHPIGGGPFRLAQGSWRPGETFVLERFAGYVSRPEESNFTGGRREAQVDRIVWRTFADPIQAVRDGQADWLESLSPAVTDDALADAHLIAGLQNPIGDYALLRLNTAEGPTANRALRQAILAMIDQTAVMEAAFGQDSDRFKTPAGLFPLDTAFYSEAGAERMGAKQSIKTLTAQVRQSGYAGEPLTLLRPENDTILAAFTTAVIAQLADIGLTVRDQPVERRALPPAGMPWSIVCETVPCEGQYDLLTAAPHGLEDMERLRTRWIDTTDPGLARQLAAQAQVAVYEDAGFVPLGQWFPRAAWRSTLAGFQRGPFPLFWGVSWSNGEH
jgi:peptide/nickel transport system substrate-binding protein